MNSVCIVSILRLHALVQLAQHPNDTTWYGGATAYWSTIEANLAIICASTPALKPLVVKVVPAFLSKRSTYGSTDNSGSGTSKGSKANRPFKQPRGAQNQATMDSHSLESGADYDLESTPADVFKGPSHTLVTEHLDQQSDNHGRSSESESQKNLVTAFPSPCIQGRR